MMMCIPAIQIDILKERDGLCFRASTAGGGKHLTSTTFVPYTAIHAAKNHGHVEAMAIERSVTSIVREIIKEAQHG